MFLHGLSLFVVCGVTVILLDHAERAQKPGEKTPVWLKNAMYWNLGSGVGGLTAMVVSTVTHFVEILY